MISVVSWKIVNFLQPTVPMNKQSFLLLVSKLELFYMDSKWSSTHKTIEKVLACTSLYSKKKIQLKCLMTFFFHFYNFQFFSLVSNPITEICVSISSFPRLFWLIIYSYCTYVLKRRHLMGLYRYVP